jgi:WD40 repeat protein
MDLKTKEEVRTFRGRPEEAWGCDLSANGRYLATRSKPKPGKAGPSRVELFDVASGQPLMTAEPPDLSWDVAHVEFSPDGRHFALARISFFPDDNNVTIWEAPSGKELVSWRPHCKILGVVYSPDGKRLVTWGQEAEAPWEPVCACKVWDAWTGDFLFAAGSTRNQEYLSPAVFSADGARVALFRYDTKYNRFPTNACFINAYDLRTGEHVFTSPINAISQSVEGLAVNRWGRLPQRGAAVAFVADRDHLLIGGRIYNLTPGGASLRLGDDLDGRVAGLAFSPDGASLAEAVWGKVSWRSGKTVYTKAAVKLWDAASGRLLYNWPHRNWRVNVRTVQFTSDGAYVLSREDNPSEGIGSEDYDHVTVRKAIKRWDVHSGGDATPAGGYVSDYILALSPDGKRAASVFDPSKGQPRLDGNLSSDTVSGIVLFDAYSGGNPLTLHLASSDTHLGLRTIAFSADGRRVGAFGDPDDPKGEQPKWLPGWDRPIPKSLRGVVWDASDGKALASLHLPEHKGADYFSLSADGKQAAAASGSAVYVWDLEAGGALRTLEGRFAVSCLAFSPDGKRLAVGSAGADAGEIALWDVARGREVLTLRGHASAVTSLTFDPAGNRLASGDEDGVVKIWDATPLDDP